MSNATLDAWHRMIEERNAAGKIDDFKVMIRPLKAVNLLHQLMGQMLEQAG